MSREKSDVMVTLSEVLGAAETLAKTAKYMAFPIVEYRGRKIKQVLPDKYIIMHEDGHAHNTIEAAIRCIDRCDKLRVD